MRLFAFILLFLLALSTYVGALWLRSADTYLQLQEPVKVIGVDTPVKLLAVNPHGIRTLEVVLEQGGRRWTLHRRQASAMRWRLWPPEQAPLSWAVRVGARQAPGLKDGPAVLRITAVSNDLRAKTATLVQDVEINTRPPVLSVDPGEHYVNQGGSGAVTFSASGYWTEAGVRVGQYKFRSFPLGQGRRISLYAYPHDVAEGVVPVVYAANPSGAEVTARFHNKIFKKKIRRREMILTDDFLQKIFRELDPAGGGHPVARFVKINSDMRRANNQALSELRLKTADRMLWKGAFLQLANSKVEAQYMDTRDYFYQGQQIDQQIHFGFDLAVTAQTPVVAANDGTVVFAGRMGIYGNTVVIDHGWGLQSIYAHLSEIEVHAEQQVGKGQRIGRSGASGLAGGDHLHFAMQVDGVPVNPVEWWDGQWIRDRVLSKLAR